MNGLGLALSTRFELSEAEQHYMQQNAILDRCYVPSKWVNWLVKAHVPDASPEVRMARGEARPTLGGRLRNWSGRDAMPGSQKRHKQALVSRFAATCRVQWTCQFPKNPKRW